MTDQPAYHSLAKMIDHSLLVPTLTADQIDAGIEAAIAYDVASVCIMPRYHRYLVERLTGTSVLPSSTVGFPHGANNLDVKRREADILIEEGCQELDMVISISAALSGDWDAVTAEIEAITSAAHTAGRKVKVIFENCYLDDNAKIRLCQICCDVGADWVKTSTGFGTGGATMEDLQLMLDNVRQPVQVKAAGGIRDYESLVRVHRMGVTRVGSSRTPSLLDPARDRENLPPIKAAVAAGY